MSLENLKSMRGSSIDKLVKAAEAVSSAKPETNNYTDDRFWVRFESDDTSTHLTAIIESVFNATTPDFKLKKPLPAKYMGYRLIVKTVPPNYIDYILLATEKNYD